MFILFLRKLLTKLMIYIFAFVPNVSVVFLRFDQTVCCNYIQNERITK